LPIVLFGTLVAAVGVVVGGLTYINNKIDERISTKVIDNVEFWEVAKDQVSQINIDKGIYEIPGGQSADVCQQLREKPDSAKTRDNGNFRTCTVKIKFKAAFEKPPIVFVSLTSFDVETHHTDDTPDMVGRFKITSSVDETKITEEGFELFVRAGKNIKLSWIEFHWLAIDTG